MTVIAGCGGFGLADGGAGMTADPGVHGTVQGYFLWANGEPTIPTGPIDPDAVRATVDRAAAVLDPDRDLSFDINIVAAFDSAEQAQTQAKEIRTILEDGAGWYADPAHAADRRALEDPEALAPMIAPDAAVMKHHLLAAGTRGMGWGGAHGTASDAVYTIGPIVFVTGLETEPRESNVDPPLHPLAHLLAAEGATVMLEGDRFGEGSIAVDATCRLTDPAGAEDLRDDIGDASLTAGQFTTRPPWIGPALTDQERLARATYRRWSEGLTAAMNDPASYDLAMRIANAANADEREAATRAFEEHIVERGLEKVEGELDPGTLALLLGAPHSPDDHDAYAAWLRDVGEQMGRLPVQATAFGEQPAFDDGSLQIITGSVRIDGERLDLGYMLFGRSAAGLPYLAAYLAEHGCDDLQVGLVDYDKIRVN